MLVVEPEGGGSLVAEAGGAAGGVLSTIDPTEIPLFEGDLAGIEAAAAKFRKAGSRCRSAGVGVDSRFQGLAGCYRAPERWELLASTARVRTGAVSFGGDLKTVGEALADYAVEMRPVAAALSRLFDRAVAFTVEVSGDGAWQRDKDLVETNNSLIAQVSTQAQAKAAVERHCANRIEALVGGRRWHAADHPGDPRFAYGAADIPDNAATPWGRPAQWEAPWHRGVFGVVCSYQQTIFGDGVIGTIDSALVLAGVYGSYAIIGSKLGLVDPAAADPHSAAMVAAWRGLALAGLAANATARPVVSRFAPGLMRDADATLVAMAKGMVGWDHWETDPGRAAALTVINVGTMALPGGELSTAIRAVKGLRAGTEVGILTRLLSHTDTPPHLPDPVTHPTIATTASRAPDLDGPMRALPDIIDQTPRHLDEPHTAHAAERVPEPARASATDGGTAPRLPDDQAPASTPADDGRKMRAHTGHEGHPPDGPHSRTDVPDGADEHRTADVDNAGDAKADRSDSLPPDSTPHDALLSGILREALSNKGNFGLGTATREDALQAGRAWVGEDHHAVHGGKILISADGLRQFRAPTYKGRLGRWQANFESRFRPAGRWQTNGHLDIGDIS